MKKSLFLLLMTSLALAACQNDKAPAAKAPAEQAAAIASTSISVEDAKKAAPPVQQKQAAVSAESAVAVTKPAETNMAQSLQAALQQTGAELKASVETAKVETLKEKSVIADKAGIAKQATAKPPVVESVVAKKEPIAAVKAALSKKQPIATAMAAKVKTAPKAVLSPPPAIPAVPAAMLGDATKGKSLARKCKTCHNFTAKNKVGPGLKGVFGRKAGIVPGMRYSPALKAGGWVWTEKNLALWVCDSKKAVKTLSGNASAKTKMSSQRICKTGKQADLIAYLKTL